MDHRHTGIKTKITLAFSAVFILLALVLNYTVYRRIRDFLIEDNDRYLLARANSLLDKTEIDPAIIPLPDKSTSIRVFYHRGSQYKLVFESPGLPANLPVPAHTGLTDTLGLRIAYVRDTGNNAEDNPAELLLITSATPLQERIHSLLGLLFFSTLVSALIAAGISYLLAGFLLQPLQRIIESARTITTRRLPHLIPVRRTHDELQELTETLNAMLSRIDHSLRQQQTFFASASHELKTPLAILRAELELNLNQPDVKNGMRTIFQSQLTEIKRLQERVEEFLVISQLKEGSLSLRIAYTDLSTIVLRVFNQLMPLLENHGLIPDVDFHAESEDFMLQADEDKLSMLLFNLVENAIKYSVPGTTLYCRIRKACEQDSMHLEIENSIPEDRIDTTKLQEAFRRGESLQRGAGLGLWLCTEIVRLHRGTISIDSGDHKFRVSLSLPLESK